ncbi:tRNA (adenosine(37)-N6)-threonylcarbamoyltransferase complex dimerization subunit type 1 TsaB [Bifidobacterium vespertilionis]|uniref:tRNA (Adenosine(37)-N6)-threonylcarbamoyltransferase complex dimerization subunit type 1 TsaB n=1 Tax=Bifidobacterium vespertilionis TaxID=2562524 RepID=A0A5J5E0A4_9BIFI|nr:tRNA (adenosine(37)-N6)-threonylcarbamoyltransferase complex dimerization subunit type 1 TsaB [Bifidobacterium vespertilionis]KAA8821261.1 tRNA (adenosine(37)-N6)-threonylcarbamoyltransferase complex dimerization subunit type 1 TsaB [Bifidobacterium vespertilionis]KAA8822528.1 tRNA (adenosine(37)-N6)-threonylcarbamoyltransferase complex dimerization subunit type 1 TsaB [Bifidobacterium vespertilionis]
MAATLVIDTSYGSTVGIVGHEPIVEADSRTHVEKLQVNIARATKAAGLEPGDIDRIIVGLGPAPFTGLRAGIVTAKALAFATGAELIGQNVLEPQAQWNPIRRGGDGHAANPGATRVLTLAVNDARRRQLYFELCDQQPQAAPAAGNGTPARPVQSEPLIAMDIDYPANIASRVNDAVKTYAAAHPECAVTVDVIGHGAAKYASELAGIEHLGDVVDASVLDQGEQGLGIFALDAILAHDARPDAPVEPLYLRRPDAEVPNPLKHVLGHGGTRKDD